MAVPVLAQENAVPPSLLVLNLELVDSSGEVTDQRADHERRLAAVREILTSELAAREVYAVVDPGKIQAEIDATRERQYLHACNGCEVRFAREVGAERVLTGHVRKVSSLIMALWIDIKDAEAAARSCAKCSISAATTTRPGSARRSTSWASWSSCRRRRAEH